MYIIIFSIILFIIAIFIFLKLLSKFSLEREKPINLFLTIKKSTFENLKNSAENFSNKLLNKFFENEDEENLQTENKINIEPTDININKFKGLNQYYSSINKLFFFRKIFIIFFLYQFSNLICLIIKFFYFNNRMYNINQFISIFDKANMAQIDLVLSIDIFKSYLFNSSIPILNSTNTLQEFSNSFLNISDKLEDFIKYTSKTKSFINGKYKHKLEQYLSGNIAELIDKKFLEANQELYNVYEKGLKMSKLRILEFIRYFTISYFYIELKSQIDNEREINPIFEGKLREIHNELRYIIRPWYNGVIDLILQSFEEYKNKSSLFYIVFFICLVVINFLFYFLVWKFCEEKLIALLKESSNLINLIPIEIKNIIIQLLNQ